MNRYPNQTDNTSFLSARKNGFLRRRVFLTSGAYTFTVPTAIPADGRGLVRFRAVLIGAGGGGVSFVGGDLGFGGSGGGGGYCEREWWLHPGAVLSGNVGAGGAGTSTGAAGGSTTLSVDGVLTMRAKGGNGYASGNSDTNLGGDIMNVGGNGANAGTAEATPKGACAGSPWGKGPNANSSSGCWREPAWDVDDPFIADGSAPDGVFYREIWGIGNGYGWSKPAGAGGGGNKQSTNSANDGMDGAVFLFY